MTCSERTRRTAATYAGSAAGMALMVLLLGASPWLIPAVVGGSLIGSLTAAWSDRKKADS
ncbi:hypothetical protein [Candidatus Poriferisocius sp.]|uniref:hypothetical protein n=1 Tax=Candidatus Poriferisocius sp. TaxID=3101276 RepID=UPI003B01B007